MFIPYGISGFSFTPCKKIDFNPLIWRLFCFGF